MREIYKLMPKSCNSLSEKSLEKRRCAKQMVLAGIARDRGRSRGLKEINCFV